MWTSDHPRSRGVYLFSTILLRTGPGSSPLARGLRRRHPGDRRREGIIPARAGFTTFIWWTPRCGWDHPRSRGVYGGVYPGTRFRVGSSPLARGLLMTHHLTWKTEGIIPARAGFTLTGSAGSPRWRDHPRSRGVYWDMSNPAHHKAGSSPLARGLPVDADGDPVAAGIIPARAGFTGVRLLLLRFPPDHPRSRGVYSSK